METSEQKFWRKCSSCKTPIGLGASYYVCSVSTCNGKRTGYVFCSVPCFERHLPGARHKDAAAIEEKAPMTPHQPEAPAQRAPMRRIVSSPTASSAPASDKTPREVLIVASRLKDYIQARSGFNTSGGVMEVLSDHVRLICDEAIDRARAEGRKTVLDRDFAFLKNLK